MRFRLRSLLIVFLLLVLSAPWWDDWWRELSNWIWPHRLAHQEIYSIVIPSLIRWTPPTCGSITKMGNAEQIAHSGKPGRKRRTAAMMAGVTDRLWTFEDLFNEVTSRYL